MRRGWGRWGLSTACITSGEQGPRVRHKGSGQAVLQRCSVAGCGNEHALGAAGCRTSPHQATRRQIHGTTHEPAAYGVKCNICFRSGAQRLAGSVCGASKVRVWDARHNGSYKECGAGSACTRCGATRCWCNNSRVGLVAVLGVLQAAGDRPLGSMEGCRGGVTTAGGGDRGTSHGHNAAQVVRASV